MAQRRCRAKARDSVLSGRAQDARHGIRIVNRNDHLDARLPGRDEDGLAPRRFARDQRCPARFRPGGVLGLDQSARRPLGRDQIRL